MPMSKKEAKEKLGSPGWVLERTHRYCNYVISAIIYKNEKRM